MIMILLQTVDIKGIHLVPHLLWIFLVEKVLLLVLILATNKQPGSEASHQQAAWE